MAIPVVIVGGGGMGRCVLDVIDAVNAVADSRDQLEVVGVVDSGRPDRDLLAGRDVPLLGDMGVMEQLPADVGYLIGVGSSAVRARLDAALVPTGRPSPVVVHPNVHRGHDVTLGPGTVLCSHVSVETHVRVGRHVHVNQNSTVGHDSTYGDYATVSPLCAMSGSITLGRGAFVGTGASVRQGITIGPDATVAMGSVVIRDVPPGVTVMGAPARVRPS